MTENQTTMNKKINIMQRWLKEHNTDDEKIRMNAKERSDFIHGLSNVLTASKRAIAILEYMQRGQVFDMPKELKEQGECPHCGKELVKLKGKHKIAVQV